MRWTVLIAVWFVGCGGKDGTARVECEEGSIAIDGECVVGGSGYEDGDGGGDDGDASGGTGGTTGSGDVSTDATVEILTPTTGTVFTEPWIDLTFEVVGCSMTSPSADPDGCHLHRTINGVPYEDPDTVAEPAGQGHYSDDPMTLYLGDPGGKNIRLVLVRNDGTDLPFQPQKSDTISVILEGEADTGSADTGTSDTGTSDTGSTDDTGAVDETGGCVIGDGCTDSLSMEECSDLGGAWVPAGCDLGGETEGDTTGGDTTGA